MQMQTKKVLNTRVTLIIAIAIFFTSSFSVFYLLSSKASKQEVIKGVKNFKELILIGSYDEAGVILEKIALKVNEEDKKLINEALVDKATKLLDSYPGENMEVKSLEFVKEAQHYSNAINSYNIIIKTDEKDYSMLRERLDNYINKIYSLYANKAEELRSIYKFQEAIRLLEEVSVYFKDNLQIKARLIQYADEKRFNEELVPYNGDIEHIFFHPLIAYTELAFDNDYQALGYDDWFVTVKEFNKIIESLYKNQYILVDINTVFEQVEVDGVKVVRKKQLMLPKNKKPMVISIDDLNYYEYMIKNGNVHKLVLDERGNVATLSNKTNGEKLISYDNEIIPILDEFVRKHSDFSFKGAKGVIGLTGYEGILGYRTQRIDATSYESEKQEALKVIKRLKETGWTFASHSYGHPNLTNITYGRLVYDTNKWKKEVESLIGPTSIYIYPYGSAVLPGDEKYKFLVDSGFKMLCAVGPTPYLKFARDSAMMDRRHIDGISLRKQGASLVDLFDAKEVFDQVRPKR